MPVARRTRLGDDRLEPRSDVEQVGDHEADRRSVVALGHEHPHVERIVDADRAADPRPEAVHRQPERRRDLDPGGADLHPRVAAGT